MLSFHTRPDSPERAAVRKLGDRILLGVEFCLPGGWDGTPDHLAELLVQGVYGRPLADGFIEWFLVEAEQALRPFPGDDIPPGPPDLSGPERGRPCPRALFLLHTVMAELLERHTSVAEPAILHREDRLQEIRTA